MQEERPLEREVLDPLSCLTSLLLPLDDYENNLQEDALNPLRPSQPKKARESMRRFAGSWAPSTMTRR
jgi:hypothetical protein